MGINTTSPQAALDINGDLIIRNTSLTLSNGSNEDINTTAAKFSHYTVTGPTSVFEIGGLTGGVDGRILTLYNSSAFLMVIKHLSAGSAAANQIHTGTGVDFTLSSYSSVSFRYQSLDNYWHVISSHNDMTSGGGHWTASGTDILNSNTGNVGIGTTPLRGRLEIAGRVGATVALFGSDAFGVGISSNNPEIGFNYFYNNGTYTIKAGYAANLGMDPSNGNLYIGNFNNNQSASDFGTISGYQNVLTITQSGRLGIKNTAPTFELDITGQQRVTGPPLSSPGLAGNLTGGGSFFINNNNNDRKSMRFSATTIQASESYIATSGSFAIPLLLNPYGGNIGIGNSDPVAPLSFNSILGNKISLWNSSATAQYGIGIQPGTLQFYTAGMDKMAFGYGSSTAFTETMSFYPGSGQLGIGTANVGGYKLAVNGNIRSKELVVETGWADYVFDEDYKLPTLAEVEKFILQNKHLPNIPSAEEIQTNGLKLGDVQTKMMAKIEELTLYIIEQNKKIELLEQRLKSKN